MPEIIVGQGTLNVAPVGDPDMPAYGVLLVGDPEAPNPDWAGTLDVDNVLEPLIHPTSGTGLFPKVAQQVVGWLIEVDDVPLPTGSTIGGKKVTLTREGPSTFSFSCPVRRNLPGSRTQAWSPIGSPFAFGGCAPGKARINVKGLYAGPSGILALPLITGGIMKTQGRRSGPAVDAFSGGDREMRFDREMVDVAEIEQGHGLSRGSILRRVFTRGEDPVPASDLAIADGGFCQKRFDIPNTTRFAFARAFMEPENRLCRYDSAGLLTNPVRVGANAAARIEATLTAAHIADGGGDVQGRSDVVTEICITGVEQIVGELGACESRTELITQNTFRVGFQPGRAAFVQSVVDGTLTATGFAALPEWPVTEPYERTRTWRTYECGTLVRELVLNEGWYWAKAARYRYALDPSLTIDGWYLAWIADPAAVTAGGGTEEAYAWPTARFVPTSALLREFNYSTLPDEGPGEYLLTTTESEARWLIRPGSMKQRTSPASQVAWDTLNFEHSGPSGGTRAHTLADGTGVHDLVEHFFQYGAVSAAMFAHGVGFPGAGPVGVVNPFRTTTTTNEVERIEDGVYITSTEEVTQSWDRRDGSQYLYSDSSTSSDTVLAFMEKERTREALTAADADVGHTAITTHSGLRIETEVVIEDRSGFLPPAAKKNVMEVPADFYQDGDVSDPKAASYYQTRPMEREVDAPGLLYWHPRRPEKVHSPYAENGAEMDAEASRRLREGSALAASIQLCGVDWSAQPNTIYHVDLPTIELDHDVEVVQVEHDDPGPTVGSAIPPITTTLQGLISIVDA